MNETTQEIIEDIRDSVAGAQAGTKTVQELVKEIRDAVSGGIMSESDVRSAISEIIGQAPEALDTLEEVAEALSGIYTKSQIDQILLGISGQVSELKQLDPYTTVSGVSSASVTNAVYGSDYYVIVELPYRNVSRYQNPYYSTSYTYTNPQTGQASGGGQFGTFFENEIATGSSYNGLIFYGGTINTWTGEVINKYASDGTELVTPEVYSWQKYRNSQSSFSVPGQSFEFSITGATSVVIKYISSIPNDKASVAVKQLADAYTKSEVDTMISELNDGLAANATLSQSWAVGGTNTRTGEDTNNAQYYAAQASSSQTAAATSAQIADTAKTAAETAQTAAEDAQAAAEAAAQTLVLDPTLTQANQAAEAKATGDAISLVKSQISAIGDTNLLNTATFAQGGYGSIANYSTPAENTVATRIRTQVNNVNASRIVIRSENTAYEYIYAVFNSSNAIVQSNGSWSASEVSLIGDIKTLRVVIRKSDDSAIVPASSAFSGIVVLVDGAVHTMADVENKFADTDADIDKYLINIDTDLILKSEFTQGSYVSINDYGTQGTDSSIRIRKEWTVTAKEIVISRSNTSYDFLYAAFDGSNNLISGSGNTWQTSNVTISANAIKTLRILIRKSNDGTILPEDAWNSGIRVVIDGKCISFTQLIDAINGAKSDVNGRIDNYIETVYTDQSDWEQGGWGSITNYSSPVPNTATIRIRSEFIANDGKPLKINCDDDDYGYVYAVFNSSGTLLAGSANWSSTSIELNYTNIYYVRIGIRKTNDGTITPADYKNSGITVTSDGTILNELDRLSTLPTPALKLKVMTYNIGRFSYGVPPYYLSTDYAEKLANYKRFFSEEMCDLIGLQEQNKYLDGASSGTVLNNDAIFDYLYPYHSDTDNWTCIKSKYPLKNPGSGAFTASSRMYSYATLDISGREIFLLCIHATPSPGETEDALRAQEMAEIISMVDDKDYFIVFGDFNAQSTSFYNVFLSEGYHIANGGYLPFEWTYSYSASDYSSDTPSANIQYFDNIVTSPNIIIDYSERRNVYADLSSDHIPFVAWFTVL